MIKLTTLCANLISAGYDAKISALETDELDGEIEITSEISVQHSSQHDYMSVNLSQGGNVLHYNARSVREVRAILSSLGARRA